MIPVARSLTLLAVLACANVPGRAGDETTLEQRSGMATLRISTAIENKVVQLPFTDLLKAILEVNGDAGLEVETPQPWTKGPWQVRPAGKPIVNQAEGKTRWSQVLLIEPLQPGAATLTLEPLRHRGSDGAWQAATWQPIAVNVTHRLTQPDLKNARDITAIEELPARSSPEGRGYLGVIAATGGVSVVVLAVWWWQRRQTQRRRRTDEDWALYELHRLQALHLPEQGKHERFGTLLAGLLRQYLERKYQAPARRRTTSEFLALLDELPELEPHRAFLQALLGRCDQLKFAPAAATATECHALAEQVHQFLSQQQASIPKPTELQLKKV